MYVKMNNVTNTQPIYNVRCKYCNFNINQVKMNYVDWTLVLWKDIYNI